MSERSEALFAKLVDAAAIHALRGMPEDADLECKEWRSHAANTGSIAKAACAFANAQGGVIVVGVVAGAVRNGEPDVITDLAPVPDPQAVKAMVIDIITRQVDPGFSGLRAEVILEHREETGGYIVVHVPEAALPQRSRVDKNFYTRVGAASIPMETYQIADRYGRRPQPLLKATITDVDPAGAVGLIHFPTRTYKIVVTNEGKGLATHPAIFFSRECPINIPTFLTPAWPLAGGPRISFRGGVNDVVYPGETKDIVQLYQGGRVEGPSTIYNELSFRTWVVCSDMPQVEQQHILPAYDSHPMLATRQL